MLIIEMKPCSDDNHQLALHRVMCAAVVMGLTLPYSLEPYHMQYICNMHMYMYNFAWFLWLSGHLQNFHPQNCIGKTLAIKQYTFEWLRLTPT